MSLDKYDAYRRAAKRVEARLGFFRHLAIYVVVNAGLVALNLAFSPDYLWFHWPLAGWAIGLAAHFVSVFGLGGAWVERWRQRQIQKELDREKRE